jgi:hypothetical protein
VDKVDRGSGDEGRRRKIKECIQEVTEVHGEYKHDATILAHSGHPGKQEVIQ